MPPRVKTGKLGKFLKLTVAEENDFMEKFAKLSLTSMNFSLTCTVQSSVIMGIMFKILSPG